MRRVALNFNSAGCCFREFGKCYAFAASAFAAAANADIDGVMIDNGANARIIIARGALNIKNGIQIDAWNGARHGVIISNGEMKTTTLRLSTGEGLPRENFIELHGADAKLTTTSITISEGNLPK